MLALELLGSPRVTLDGKISIHLPTARIQALLFLLAVECRRPPTREQLMAILWPEMPQTSAQQNLRQSIYMLRRALPDDAAGQPALRSERALVQFNPDYPFSLDVDTFVALTDVRQPPEAWQAGVEHYRGDFLAGFALPDAASFEDWAAARRAWLQARMLDTLDALAGHYLGVGALPDAAATARRQLALDNLDERGHRQLMIALAADGRRADALAHYDLCRAILHRELEVDPAPETQALAAEIRRGTPLAPPRHPHSAQSTPRANLPPRVPPLIGRDAELGELDRLCAQPDAAVTTITGPGGIGKSHLALAWARRQVDETRFADGVFWVDLTPVADTAMLPAAVAEALALPLRGGSADDRPVATQVLDFLRGKRLLLILDNFEHLTTGAGFVAEAVKTAPEIKVLVTSRVRLPLKSGYILPLEGLAVPANEDDVEHAGAAQLFLHTMRRLNPSQALAPQDKAALVRICRQVEGLPLAVELAAAWTGTLPLPAIEAAIGQSLDLLAADVEDVPPRHRSMRAAFDVSWRLLDEDEQLTFAQSAVFAGPFTTEALQAVVRVRGDRAPGHALIARLAGKSLLRFHPATDRYSVHELLRQYGAEQRRDEQARAAARHAGYYAARVMAADTDFHAGRYPEAFQAFEEDLAQILHAWRWHIAHDGIHALTGMLDSLMFFVERRGRYADAFALLSNLLDHFGSPGTGDEAVRRRLVARTLAHQTTFDPDVAHARQTAADAEALLAALAADGVDVRREAALLHLCTGSLLHRIDVPAAHAALVQSVAIFRELGDAWGLFRALVQLGTVLFWANRYGEAIDTLEEARQMSVARNCAVEEVQACQILLDCAAFNGDIDAARRYAQEGLTRLPAVETPADRIDRAILEYNLATYENNSDRAIASLSEGVALMHQLGRERDTAYNTVYLGMLALSAGYYDRVAGFLDTAKPILQRVEPSGCGVSTFALQVRAMLAMVEGEMARADQLLAEVIDRYCATDTADPGPLVYRALTTHALGRGDEARRWMLEALQMLAQRFGQLPAGEWLLAASLFLVDEGELARAAELFAVADLGGAVCGSALYMDLAGREVAAAIAQLPAVEQQATSERAAGISLTTIFPALYDEFSTRWRTRADATETEETA